MTKELEPLYGLAVSAKRYVLFNIGAPTKKYPKGETILRKISGHGLGHLRHIPGYDPSAHPLTKAEHVAAPTDKEKGEEVRRLEAAYERGESGISEEDVRAAQRGQRNYGDLIHGGTPRMLCDIWRIAVNCFREFPNEPGKALNKIDDIIAKLPQLQVPQYAQMSLSSTHLWKLFPNLPNRRGFQFFSTFPNPICSINSRDLISVPLDAHKALCKTTLYANVPPEGVGTNCIEEWTTTKTGLFRRDNHKFPHGLFDPGWRLRLKIVAEVLAGYFRHEEPKSVGDVGVLGRRIIVSLDKHFIGKETNPLDDDNEDAQDDEPITTSNDLVLRSATRNLQPLVEAGIEFRKGKRLTNAEIKTIKSRTILQLDGSLKARSAMEDGYVQGYISDPLWAARLKTWRELNKVGRFVDVAEVADVPATEIEMAARYGNHDDKCGDINWGVVQAAIDELTGRAARRNKAWAARNTATRRTQFGRQRKKLADLLVVLSGGIEDGMEYEPTFDELDAQVVRNGIRKMVRGLVNLEVDPAEIVRIADEIDVGCYIPPEVEYWGKKARRRRAALRVARHRMARMRQKPDDRPSRTCAAH